jgi:hypothetical protein
MRLFSRHRPSRFPADMAAWLETFGRARLDPLFSRVDSAAWWERVPQLCEVAKDNQDGFLADLAPYIADDPGGFVTLGAAGLVWEVLGSDVLSIPAALPFIDAAIAVKKARGLPGLAFTGYEWERLHSRREPN